MKFFSKLVPPVDQLTVAQQLTALLDISSDRAPSAAGKAAGCISWTGKGRRTRTTRFGLATSAPVWSPQHAPSSRMLCVATGHQHGSQWPRKDDPVLEHLLRDYRSAALRKQFFAHDPQEYTDTLDVKLLVRTVYGSEWAAVRQQLHSKQAQGSSLGFHSGAEGSCCLPIWSFPLSSTTWYLPQKTRPATSSSSSITAQ